MTSHLVFCGTGDGTKDFLYFRHEIYQLSYTPRPSPFEAGSRGAQDGPELTSYLPPPPPECTAMSSLYSTGEGTQGLPSIPSDLCPQTCNVFSLCLKGNYPTTGLLGLQGVTMGET